MIPILVLVIAALLQMGAALRAAEPPPAKGPRAVALFDGKTLANWEGNPKLWRVQDGCLTGGSLTETVTHNDFLATTRNFTDFVVRFEIKLIGTAGFINSGFQIRSQRVPNNSEMSGYQCDYGEPDWYGAIYDESRRNKVLSPSNMKELRPVLKTNDWNTYIIRAEGPHITTWINGVMGTDYIENDSAIPDWGKMGIQVHAGGKALVQVRNIFVEELPAPPPGKFFRGAPEPQKKSDNTGADRGSVQTASKAEPVSAEEELTRFTVAPGFQIELVASEDIPSEIGKFVAIDWDQHGNLWTMTALEYPVDANENPAVARELYASHARDKVLVYDRDPAAPTGYKRTPRVFADGLAIPLGILPYKNGVYVQHGPEIVFLNDSNGDGKADERDVILSGFGVQDSHLFPHQFTRAPGNWIWFAQGAFNYGKVRTTRGGAVQFDQTRMAKFRYDGSDFDITSQGPCNIWGLFMTMQGQTWIQEANDYGYPAMLFEEYANYPGCSQAQWKSYAPEFPGTAPHFAMGGTGLSGLAMTDDRGWPEAYCGVIYIANPITRKIQAIRAKPERFGYHLSKLPDFIQSSDEMFRPVALRLGPDGALYFVDWYNKIISHNEVPRNHPERDKKRGRIWRVKPAGQKLLDVPDLAMASGDVLLEKLGGENTTQSHLAWQAIHDRVLQELAPELQGMMRNEALPSAKRIAALWAFEGLPERGSAAHRLELARIFLSSEDRNLRREAMRFLAGNLPLAGGLHDEWNLLFELLERAANDFDPEVRAECIKTTVRALSHCGEASDPAVASLAQIRAMPILAAFGRPSTDQPTMRSTQNGRLIKTGSAYDRDFERYLVRMFLEKRPREVQTFLLSPAAARFPEEHRLLLALALEPKSSAVEVARLLPQVNRPASQEEILRLAEFADQPEVGGALKQIVSRPASQQGAIESLLSMRARIDSSKLNPLLTEAGRELLAAKDIQSQVLGARLASSFQLSGLETDLARIAEPLTSGRSEDPAAAAAGLSAANALAELKSGQVELFVQLARKEGDPAQLAGIRGLGSSRDAKGPRLLASLYPKLTAAPRRSALASLTGTKEGSAAFVKAVRSGSIGRDELDGAALDRLQAVLGDDPDLAALLQEMGSFFRPVLRLNGEDNAWTDSDITLTGPFTVETWVKLDPGIDNNDGILGSPGALDMNFHDAQFRVWAGGGVHDAIIAKKKIVANAWTHVAVTRDSKGLFKIYLNGQLDNEESKPASQKFEHCRIGWTAPPRGTAGFLSEFRVWDRTRTADEIRNDFDRSFEGAPLPSGLARYFPGGGPWGKLQAGAKVIKSSDYPPLLNEEESKKVAAKFAQFHALAAKAGDNAKGKAIFTTVCMTCHSVGGQGGQVGPVLNGAGALGVEALLRNILTPSAAMEPGYRMFRVELVNGDVLEGIRVSEDANAIVLRRPNVEDLRIQQKDVRKAGFTKLSMMPEGLIDALPPEDVSNLFAYLKTLK